MAAASNLIAWLLEGVPTDWDEPRSLATVLVDLGEAETLVLRFRLALTERLRELAEEGGDV